MARKLNFCYWKSHERGFRSSPRRVQRGTHRRKYTTPSLCPPLVVTVTTATVSVPTRRRPIFRLVWQSDCYFGFQVQSFPNKYRVGLSWFCHAGDLRAPLSRHLCSLCGALSPARERRAPSVVVRFSQVWKVCSI